MMMIIENRFNVTTGWGYYNYNYNFCLLHLPVTR